MIGLGFAVGTERGSLGPSSVLWLWVFEFGTLLFSHGYVRGAIRWVVYATKGCREVQKSRELFRTWNFARGTFVLYDVSEISDKQLHERVFRLLVSGTRGKKHVVHTPPKTRACDNSTLISCLPNAIH